ncbi:MAG: nitroreductase family protein [Lachnotalea sp.]
MLEAIENRRSIRKYKNIEIESEKINDLLNCARLAPSGSNTQSASYIIVNDEDNRRKLAKASHNQEWMMAAPTFIVCVADICCRLKEEEGLIIGEGSSQEEVKQIIRDTAIAAEHIVIEASHLGLGSCYVAWFKQEQIRPLLHIPSDKYVVCILTLGYPDESPKPRPRKRLDELVHYEKW